MGYRYLTKNTIDLMQEDTLCIIHLFHKAKHTPSIDEFEITGNGRIGIGMLMTPDLALATVEILIEV
jgi:hypothetical protein